MTAALWFAPLAAIVLGLAVVLTAPRRVERPARVACPGPPACRYPDGSTVAQVEQRAAA